ncbi:MAG TPA: deoxyribonuclease IV [Erysipelotrichaceae bacterium]|nr:deoxyribonuclease IV [Erysipelotrichaceae bacterium]
MAKDLLIGSHVSMNAPDYYLGSVKEAISYNASTLMFYTGAPQNSYRKPLKELKIEEGRALLKEHGMDENYIVVHAPYIVNLANTVRQDLLAASIEMITTELQRTAAFGARTFVLHPGNHLGAGEDLAIQTLVSSLNQVFQNDGTEVKIALETMAGKGSEIGTSFASLKKIIDLCDYPERLGVCIDTCHMNDFGYDVHDIDGLLKEFDEIIGLNRLLVVHLNDSKNVRGSNKDRHENLGYGEIGFETLCAIANHPLLKDVPKILETPYVDKKPPYALEIQMLRDEKYIENWKEKI